MTPDGFREDTKPIWKKVDAVFNGPSKSRASPREENYLFVCSLCQRFRLLFTNLRLHESSQKELFFPSIPLQDALNIGSHLLHSSTMVVLVNSNANILNTLVLLSGWVILNPRSFVPCK